MVMNKEQKELYDRIKGYDIQSLCRDLDRQLQIPRQDSNKSGEHGHKGNVICLRQTIIGWGDVLQGSRGKRITLEQAMEKSPERVEKLIQGIIKASNDYGCII